MKLTVRFERWLVRYRTHNCVDMDRACKLNHSNA